MTKVYIVRYSCGAWDDEQEAVDSAYFDKEIAEAKQVELINEARRNNKEFHLESGHPHYQNDAWIEEIDVQ